MTPTDHSVAAPEFRAIEHALSRPWYQMRLPGSLEQQYEAATITKRARTLRVNLAALLLFSIACLMLDRKAGVFHLGLVLRLGVSVPLLLTGMIFVSKQWPVWCQGLAVALPVISMLIGVIYLGLTATGVYSDRFIMEAGVLIFSINLYMPLRYAHALYLTLTLIAIYIYLSLGGFGGRSASSAVDLVLFLSAMSLLALNVPRKLEISNKNRYLYRLKSGLQSEALIHANIRLSEMSNIDALTGIGNRRRFEQALQLLWPVAADAHEHLGLLMIDIDHFKTYNDAAGHVRGDECLRLVAQTIANAIRQSRDVVARYGGEEFVVVLPATTLQETIAAGERIRRAVEVLRLPHSAAPSGTVTISVGAACIEANEPDPSGSEALLKSADEALYDAKRSGRNCVMPRSADPAHFEPVLLP